MADTTADLLNIALAKKAEAEAGKAEAEVALIQLQRQPEYRRLEALRSAAGASGLMLAAVSVFGALGSVAAWSINQANEREVRIDERLDRALGSLSQKEDPMQRAGSLAMLKGFLDGADKSRARRAVVAVTEALAVETDKGVSLSMVAFLRQLAGIDKDALNAGIQSLAEKSRLLKRQWLGRPTDDEKRQLGASMSQIGSGIESLLRSGARTNLDGIDLVGLDLSGLDLREMSFRRAYLGSTKFDDAQLMGADFTDADLWEVSFRDADLTDAILSQPGRVPPDDWLFMLGHVWKGWLPHFPNFTCANLNNADLTWLPTVMLLRPASARAWEARGSDFAGADLTGAKMAKLSFVGYAPPGTALLEPGDWPFPLPQGLDVEAQEVTAKITTDGSAVRQSPIDPSRPLESRFLPSAPGQPLAANRFEPDFEQLRTNMRWSNWTEASLPQSIRQILSRQGSGAAASARPVCVNDWKAIDSARKVDPWRKASPPKPSRTT